MKGLWIMKNFKWIVALMLAGLFVTSCLDDEPTLNVDYVYAPIDSIMIGEIHPAREVTEIRTYFTRNSECEAFFDYDYQIVGNERTVSIIVSDLQNENCLDISEADSQTLQFRPESAGDYTFRFWAGNDENDEPIFIVQEITIPE